MCTGVLLAVHVNVAQNETMRHGTREAVTVTNACFFFVFDTTPRNSKSAATIVPASTPSKLKKKGCSFRVCGRRL